MNAKPYYLNKYLMMKTLRASFEHSFSLAARLSEQLSGKRWFPYDYGAASGQPRDSRRTD